MYDTLIPDDIKLVALGMFRREGIDRVSVASICREANVANGSFYNFFENKDALLDALAADAAAALAGELAARPGAAMSPREEQHRDVAVIARFVRANADLFMLVVGLHSRPSGKLSPISLFIGQRQAEIADRIADGRYRHDLNARSAAIAEIAITTEIMRDWVGSNCAAEEAAVVGHLARLRCAMLIADPS